MNAADLQDQLLAVERDLECSALFRDNLAVSYTGDKPSRQDRLAKLDWKLCNWRQLDVYFDLVEFLTARGFLLVLSGVLRNLLSGNSGLSESIFVGHLLRFPIHELDIPDANAPKLEIKSSHIHAFTEALDFLLSTEAPLNEMGALNLRDDLALLSRNLKELSAI